MDILCTIFIFTALGKFEVIFKYKFLKYIFPKLHLKEIRKNKAFPQKTSEGYISQESTV